MKCLSRGSAAVHIAVGLAVVLAGAARLEAAALLPAQQDKVSAVDASLQKAADLYRKHKFEELGKLVDSIEKGIDELKSGEGEQQAAPQIEQLQLRLAAAQKLLRYALDSAVAEKEAKDAGKKKLAARPGARKPLVKPGAKPTAMVKANTTTKPGAMAGRNMSGGISFAGQIAPLLQSKCGRCHSGNAPKGQFSVATYADIRRGSDSGTVFNPGKGQGSRLMDLLETGEMPKGGNKLSPDELTMISTWIDMGAPYDADPVAMATAGTGGISRPTGNETVSFMTDIAPVIVAKCTRCHGGERGSDNMELDTFARIMKGGRTGDIISAGLPSSSLLIQMIEGTARDKTGPRRRMPDRSPPLAKDVIEKIRTWIAEGAKFDGDDPNALLEFQLRVIKASKATHEELSKIRDEEAKKNWALGNPGVNPVVVDEDALRIVGDLTPVRMKELAELAKGIQAKVASALRAPPGKPMYKGRLTIFVFSKRFEYSEFGQMVEKREIPPDSHGSFRYTVVDGYMCVLNNREDDPNLPLLLAEGMVGSYIETLGKNLPRWFTIGAARAMAAKMESRAPLVKQWDEAAMNGGGSMGNLDQFLKAKQLDSAGSAMAYIIGRGMAPRLPNALDAMRKGAGFQQAIMRAYGSTPQAVAASWLK
jgi:hypothetical protein